MPTLGKQIRANRKKRGWSQEVLADMVRVHRTTVQNWELGKHASEGAAPMDVEKDSRLRLDRRGGGKW